MAEFETIKTEAKRLQVSTSTVRRWVNDWKDTARGRDLITDGRTIRIRHAGLVEWLGTRRKGERA